MSSFSSIRSADDGLRRLKQDVESGDWARKYVHLLSLDAIDLGYRMVVAHGSNP